MQVLRNRTCPLKDSPEVCKDSPALFSYLEKKSLTILTTILFLQNFWNWLRKFFSNRFVDVFNWEMLALSYVYILIYEMGFLLGKIYQWGPESTAGHVSA